MLSVPSLQFGIWYSDKLMCDSSIFFIHHALLADRITLPLRNEVDPEVVVDSADSDTKGKSV
jgi:hypothetical protein